MTWLSVAPVALLAAAWLVLPGLAVTYAGGLRGSTAWGTAPLLSVGLVAVGAVLAGAAGLTWSPVLVPVLAVLVAALTATGRLLLHRVRPPAQPADRDGRLPAAGAVLGTLLAVVLGWLTVRRGMGSPDALSQTYDAVFHYNAVTRILEDGNASSLTLGTVRSPAAGAFYPAAWHDVVSLVVLGSGADVPVASNTTALAVAAVVWPLGCLALVRQLVGAAAIAALVTPLVSVGFIAFPWTLLSFGVLWPNLVGFALLPAALAAVVALAGRSVAEHAAMTRPQAAGLTAVAVAALGLAHPNAVISLVVLGAVPSAWALVRWVALGLRAGRRLLPAAVAAVALATAAGLAWFLAASPLFAEVRSFDWPAFETPPQAVGEVLTNATNKQSAAWAISLVVVVGLVAAARTPSQRWLIPTHLVSGGLYMVAASLETPLASLLTGLWYNDSYRLAAVVPVTGVPLAVLGLLLLGERLADALVPRHEGRARPDGPRDAALLTGVATLVLVVVSSGLYLREHGDVLARAYAPTTAAGVLVDPAERAFFTRIAPLVPDGAVVAQNPWSGSSLLEALTGRRVLFPHLDGNWTPDQQYLARHLRDAAADPQACAAANRLNVEFLLIGAADFWAGDPRAHDYPGLTDPAPGAGFRLLADDGAGDRLYRLEACGR